MGLRFSDFLFLRWGLAAGMLTTIGVGLLWLLTLCILLHLYET